MLARPIVVTASRTQANTHVRSLRARVAFPRNSRVVKLRKPPRGAAHVCTSPAPPRVMVVHADPDDVRTTEPEAEVEDATDTSVEDATKEVEAEVVEPHRVMTPEAIETKKADVDSDDEALAEMTRVLQTSLSPRAAALIAKGFVDLGVESPRDLRRAVAKRSSAMIGIEALATIFNGLMCFSLFSLAAAAQFSDFFIPSFWNYVVTLLGMVGAAIFAVEAGAHLFITAVYVYSTIRFETTDLRKFVQSMQRIGDNDHIIGVVPQSSTIKRASTLVHVVNVLNNLRDALHSEAEIITPTHKSTLHNLAAYFEYSNAQAKQGFKPEDYGLDSKQCMAIASLFSEWDTDGSGTLRSEELSKLLRSLGDDTINDMDVNMAMRILDKNETGEIDFGEFVKWYKDGVKLPDTMTASKSGADDLEDIDPNTRIDEITG